MKIAVVGSGPAAVAVLAAINLKQLDAEVTVFDVGQEPQPSVAPPPRDNPNDRDYLVRLYKELRKTHGFSFPPPKSQFGYVPGRTKVDQKDRVWTSAGLGGLSQIWGASVFPFTDRELKNWPLTADELAPYYSRVAEMIGISGADDGLSDYFGSAEVNRPPTELMVPFKKLAAVSHEKSLESGVKFISGVARLALETRENQENKCISCGGCMTGCSRGTVYCSASDFDRFKSIGIVNHHVIAKVLSFDRAQRTLKIFKDNTIEITPSFDRIYLGAGCLGTSEIIMRSFEIADGPVMQDNTVFTFPLFYFGRTEARARLENSQVLTNLVIGRIPSAPNSALTQIQFYSTFEHLWRYYLPPIIWPVADWFGHFLKSRLVWGRIYLPGDQSQHYSLHLEGDDKLELKLAKKGGAKADLMPILNDLKAMLAGSGFVIPPIGPIRHPTSSHYAATFPYGGNLLNLPPSGEVSPGIFICDSTVFNQSPSISPTFTIMANAWRTADQSLLY